MKVEICTVMYCAPSTTIDIPGIDSWDQVKEWFVKWDTLHYTLDGETWHEIELDSFTSDSVDWKRPASVTISNPETREEIETDE